MKYVAENRKKRKRRFIYLQCWWSRSEDTRMKNSKDFSDLKWNWEFGSCSYLNNFYTAFIYLFIYLLTDATTAEQLIVRKIWHMDPGNSLSIEFRYFVASEELLSLTHPRIHLPLSFYHLSLLCLSSPWTKMILNECLLSLSRLWLEMQYNLSPRCKNLYLHSSCLPLCQSIITALCCLSFLRADLRFLPAHKSQTQSSRPWREPSNHRQPQIKGRGYLTPVPISSHLARTHTWLMRQAIIQKSSTSVCTLCVRCVYVCV